MAFDTNILLFAGLGLAGILLVVGIVISATSEKNLVEERLGRYMDDEQEHNGSGGQKETPVSDWVNKRMEKSSWGGSIAKELARADLKLKPGEYLFVMILSSLGTGMVAWFLLHRSILLGLVFAIVGIFLPRLYVRREQGKRLRKFDEQLSDMLNLMVNGLRAGYSTMQAMEAVSRELPAPICDEFRRVVQEMQLGLPMGKALDNLMRRIPSDDLDMVITAINVQREVGGNLAEILDTISFTIRERVRIKGEIRVLTSQAMISGQVLSFLPIALLGMLYLINRDYMMTFFDPENVPCGYIALGLAGFLIIAGYFTMKKISQVDV